MTRERSEGNCLHTFYIDGQSIGNENVERPRNARTAIVYQLADPGRGSNSTRVLSEDVGDRTNNEAEYQALLRLLSLLSARWAGVDGRIPQRVGTVRICSDSELVVHQVNGDWKVREERLKGLREDAKMLIDRMGSIGLEWVPREQNLAGLWLEGKLNGIRVTADQFLPGL